MVCKTNVKGFNSLLRLLTRKDSVMLLLKIEPEYEGDYEQSYVNRLRYEEVTIGDMLKKMSDYELQQYGLVRINPDENKKIGHYAVQALKQAGWAHAAAAKTREERKVLDQKFYILNEKGSKYAYYDPMFAVLDMDGISDELMKRLVEGAEIVQKVRTKSVLSAKDYKRFKTIQKKMEAAKKKAADSKAAKIAKKKQKEIEAAKKLLAEAGEVK